jgi:hypothetical protein
MSSESLICDHKSTIKDGVAQRGRTIRPQGATHRQRNYNRHPARQTPGLSIMTHPLACDDGRPRSGRRSSAAAIVLLFMAACSSNPPKLREGLWEIRAQSIQKPGDIKTDVAYKLCRDHAYDQAAVTVLKKVKGCTTALKTVGANQFASASNCTVNGVTIISSGVTTFRSAETTHSETQATYVPAFNGKTAETMTQDQQYVSVCPPTMKVGDTLSAEGFIRHHD